MSGYGTKLLIAASLMLVGVVTGIQIASTGIERVHGPQAVQVAPAVQRQPVQQLPSPPVSVIDASSAAQHTSLETGHELTFINRFAVKSGDMLRWAARGFIRIIGSAFEKMVH